MAGPGQLGLLASPSPLLVFHSAQSVDLSILVWSDPPRCSIPVSLGSGTQPFSNLVRLGSDALQITALAAEWRVLEKRELRASCRAREPERRFQGDTLRTRAALGSVLVTWGKGPAPALA